MLGQEARRLVKDHVPLVQRMARTMASHSALYEAEELAGDGFIGLIQAAARFNSRRGIRFDIYAIPRVRGAMIEGLRAARRWSRCDQRRRVAFEEVQASLRQALGREPERSEVLDAMETSPGPRRNLERWQMRRFESLDAISELPHPDGNPAAGLEAAERRRLVALALIRLPRRDKRILHLYYRDDLTMKQIGKKLGVGESRISQLHSEALARVRAALAEVRPPRRQTA